MKWLKEFKVMIDNNPDISDAELYRAFPELQHRPARMDAALMYWNKGIVADEFVKKSFWSKIKILLKMKKLLVFFVSVFLTASAFAQTLDSLTISISGQTFNIYRKTSFITGGGIQALNVFAGPASDTSQVLIYQDASFNRFTSITKATNISINGVYATGVADLLSKINVASGGTHANLTTGDAGIKTTTFNGITQTNFNFKGVYININLGTVSGTTPTLSAQIQWSPDAGTTWINMGPPSANLTTTGSSGVIMIYPTNFSSGGASGTALTTGAAATLLLNMVLPKTWRIVYTIGGTTPSFAITNVQVNYIL